MKKFTNLREGIVSISLIMRNLSSDRKQLLSQPPVDITPNLTERKFIWSKAQDLNKFEDEYSLKPVKVSGIFDHTKEYFVEKHRDGELGVDVITPFYTHLNEKGEECGILVNRGFLPFDLIDTKQHYVGAQAGEIVGVLYRGDNPTKYSKTNSPTIGTFTIVKPYDFAVLAQLKNRDEASQFMLQ